MNRKRESEEKRRRSSQQATRSALRASMVAIEAESRRLAKGKVKSDEMVKKGKLPDLDKQMQSYIQNSLKGVLGHLGNIAGAVATRGEELKQVREEGGGLADVLMGEHPEKKRLRAHSVSPLPTGVPEAQRR